MTYLELINKVMRELRERQVSDLSADYTLLVGQFVNDAKDAVERAWKWKALRTNITFNTVSGTQDYNLGTGGVGSGGTTTQKSSLVYNDKKEPQLFITTNNYESRLVEVPRERHVERIAYDLDSNAQPTLFSTKRSSTGITVSIYPKPDGVYALQGTFYIPQDELSVYSTTISCPPEPVWKLALAYATSERGGGMGESAGPLYDRADRALWAAITEEAEDSELTFYEE